MPTLEPRTTSVGRVAIGSREHPHGPGAKLEVPARLPTPSHPRIVRPRGALAGLAPNLPGRFGAAQASGKAGGLAAPGCELVRAVLR